MMPLQSLGILQYPTPLGLQNDTQPSLQVISTISQAADADGANVASIQELTFFTRQPLPKPNENAQSIAATGRFGQLVPRREGTLQPPAGPTAGSRLLTLGSVSQRPASESGPSLSVGQASLLQQAADPNLCPPRQFSVSNEVSDLFRADFDWPNSIDQIEEISNKLPTHQYSVPSINAKVQQNAQLRTFAVIPNRSDSHCEAFNTKNTTENAIKNSVPAKNIDHSGSPTQDSCRYTTLEKRSPGISCSTATSSNMLPIFVLSENPFLRHEHRKVTN